MFTGTIVIFMIEMGIIAGQRLDDIKKVGSSLLFCSFIPVLMEQLVLWLQPTWIERRWLLCLVCLLVPHSLRHRQFCVMQFHKQNQVCTLLLP